MSLKVKDSKEGDFELGGRVELQLITTLQCNLKCSYCSLGTGDMIGSQTKIEYDLDQLAAFVDKHLTGREVYVTFYGGEPTLNPNFIKSVMDRFPWFRFQLQTNGTLLSTVEDSVLNRLSNVLVSVDGDATTTDGYRGRGVYDRVMSNLARVEEKIPGTLTARMTWGKPDTRFEEFDSLVAPDSHFDYLYWQFVTGDLYSQDSIEKRKAVIVQLVDRFFSRTDVLYPMIPLMGIVRNKIFPAKALELYEGKAQCRVSTHLLNIMPSGKIFPCPDLLYLPEMQMGDIKENWLKKSPLQFSEKMPCEGCEAYSWCRGNCIKDLYLTYVKGDEKHKKKIVEPICDLLRFLGEEIDRHNPREWYGRASLEVRKQITDCEVYDYVEVMP